MLERQNANLTHFKAINDPLTEEIVKSVSNTLDTEYPFKTSLLSNIFTLIFLFFTSILNTNTMCINDRSLSKGFLINIFQKAFSRIVIFLCSFQLLLQLYQINKHG